MDAQDIEMRIIKMEKDIKDMKEAFPRSLIGQPDYVGHREFHERAIASARSQEKFWNELRADLFKKGTWFILIIMLGLMVNGVLYKLGIIK